MTNISETTKLEKFRRSGFLRRAAEALGRDDVYFREVLDILAAAVYVTDADGRITYYNEAAAALWGARPNSGKVCGVGLGSSIGRMEERCRTINAQWR